MGMRRFTRMTNGSSMKLADHESNVALHFMHYNFARIHQTLRTTPAMSAGLTDHVWEFSDETCYNSVVNRATRFFREFYESSKGSRRTEWLFVIAFLLFIPTGTHVNEQVWFVCALCGCACTVAGIISLAIDNTRK
jgi:hypothetical protein